ncbi:MAG: stage 0 sporulation family protein [Bacilli bacterium]|nr:stage 0 sporulation family protein [Bacilli bacterium]
MVKIVGIQFKGAGKVYYFNPLNIEFEIGEYAIVETVRGVELGKIIIANRDVEDEQIEYELKPVVRKANENDLAQEQKNEELAKKSFEVFKKYVKVCNLDMKPLYAEYTIDQTKIIFYYTAEDRVDFRELLKHLTPEFKIRVELRQIGPREAARALGGLGVCGRELCCKTHLQNFDFVTMKMAKEQGMSLNNNKISGACGKLMCCIAYEVELYKEMKKEFPAVGSSVKTNTCECCKVVGVDFFKKLVKTEETPGGMPVVHKLEEIDGFSIAKSVEEPELIVTAEEVDDNIEMVVEEKVEEPEELTTEEKQKKARYNRYKKKFKKDGKKQKRKNS